MTTEADKTPAFDYANLAEAEAQDVKNFAFSDQSIRKGFIRKVFLILMAQLVVTFGVVSLFVFHDGTREVVGKNRQLMWIALILVLVTSISMACCEVARRKLPLNFIFLGVFTGAEAFLIGVISTRYDPDQVLLAIGITAAVCLALTAFATQTKYDFTAIGGILFVALVIFILFGLIAMFIPGKVMSLVYSSIGALLFSVYLVYDIQLMMGGEHKYSISPEEYVFAALNLYLDIVNIFMYILSIVGGKR